MMRPRIGKLLVLCAALFLLAACRPVTAQPDAVPAPPAADAPTAEASQGPETADLPPAVEYNLGDAVLIQDQFPTDSRFREMPVRLNGLIGVPEGEGGPYPLVVILHGTHPGCPSQGEVDTWPCAPEDEQRNYFGFDYLVSALAANGYVAIVPNSNAENTFGFGEPQPRERLAQLLDLHLQSLAEAVAGGENGFGVDLAGRVDMQRLVLVGHSRGGESAVALANDPNHSLGVAGGDYGPAAGTLLLAAAIVTYDPVGGSRVPMAIVLPACDGDVTTQDGQHFYEAARLAPDQTSSAVSAWLEKGNHNSFNSILGDDPFGRPGRPECETILEPEVQQAWTVSYTLDFLTTLFSSDPAAVRSAMMRMGSAPFEPAPSELYGLPGKAAALAAANNRLPLFVPASAEELVTSPAGGAVTAEGVTTTFCPEGFYSAELMPGTEACRRNLVTVPGQPAHVVVEWQEPGGALRIALPPGVGLLNFFDALSIRAAVDPMSPLNAEGETQAFSVRLTDGAGNTAVLSTRPDEPALQFPKGTIVSPDISFFSAPVPMTTIRFGLRDFEGVNLIDIVEVALIFDGKPSGALFLADLELLRSPVGAQETLDQPPSAEKIAAAEAGDVEAMRQLANVYRPTEAMGVSYGNLERAVFWYRQACAAGYANAQVDFYDFARTWAETTSDEYLAEAVVCLESAIEQGHRGAIISGAFRAAYIDFDYPRAWYLYALLEDADPEIAQQRERFAEELTQAQIDESEAAAAAWRAENEVRDYDDFFAEVNSPFRPVP